MPKPSVKPLWASTDVTYDAMTLQGVRTLTNKAVIPEYIQTQGLLYKVPLDARVLNAQFDLISDWVDYLDSPEKPIIIETTTARTLIASDKNAYLNFTNASAVGVTVNKGLFPIGTRIEFHQDAAGQVTLTGGTGVTIKAPYLFANKTAGNGATIWITKYSETIVTGVVTAEVWHCAGEAGT